MNNFEFDTDLFYYDYSARQVSQLNNVDGALVIFTSVNPAVIQGWESNIKYAPTADDTIDLGVILTQSHYVHLGTYLAGTTGPIGAPIDLAGRSLDNMPPVADAQGVGVTDPRTWGFTAGITF